MKKYLKYLPLGLLVIIAGLLGYTGVYAVDINISGKAPTTNTDNSTLTDLASIRIYKALAPTVAGCATATYSVLVTLPFTTSGGTFSTIDTNQTQNGVYCYKATALDTSGNESAASNTATKSVDLLFPSAPTNLTAS